VLGVVVHVDHLLVLIMMPVILLMKNVMLILLVLQVVLDVSLWDYVVHIKHQLFVLLQQLLKHLKDVLGLQQLQLLFVELDNVLIQLLQRMMNVIHS